jgi:integrase
MSVDLRAAAADYLAGRRARGYRLKNQDSLIARFLDGLEARAVTVIGVADAVAFAQDTPAVRRRRPAERLHVIRGLAAYIHTLDPTAAELVPDRLFAGPSVRRIPYLYTPEQTVQLMDRAGDLRPEPFAAAIRTLIGLVAATGLRSGEAFGLDIEDLDREQGLLRVTGKYAKQRLVPLHPSTIDALDAYLQVRATTPAAATGPLLVGPRGGRLNSNAARALFRVVVNDCGLESRPGCSAPRLHDFRHAFAVDTLIDAHRHGGDVDARIATLATYLGHVDPANTYWYLTASPELMAIVTDRMTAHQHRGRP